MKAYRFLLCAAVVLGVGSCKKEAPEKADCEQLKQAILADNIALVREQVATFIAGLPSDRYTQENLEALAKSISAQCNISTAVLCFDCIKTLPSQSEIHIRFAASGAVTSRTIDITYNRRNQMVFNNLHE